jgi:hypothetical protein
MKGFLGSLLAGLIFGSPLMTIYWLAVFIIYGNAAAFIAAIALSPATWCALLRSRRISDYLRVTS